MVQKIFGIGLSKTGTTSLTRALTELGYRTIHYPFHILKYKKNGLELKPWRLRRYDACTDSPIARFFPELDAYYPGSKFVFLTRQIDSWLDSCESHHIWPGQYSENMLLRKTPLIRRVMQLHRDLYGSVSFNRNGFAEAYHAHEQKVRDYFEDRPGDMLTIDICGGDGWEKLCPFLGKQIPARTFPHLNEGSKTVLKRTSRRYFWKSLSVLSP